MQEDLRTIEGALAYIGCLPFPGADMPLQMITCYGNAKETICELWPLIPPGAGKTRWVNSVEAMKQTALKAIATDFA